MIYMVRPNKSSSSSLTSGLTCIIKGRPINIFRGHDNKNKYLLYSLSGRKYSQLISRNRDLWKKLVWWFYFMLFGNVLSKLVLGLIGLCIFYEMWYQVLDTKCISHVKFLNFVCIFGFESLDAFRTTFKCICKVRIRHIIR